jgi:hypothetical protein
MRYWICALASLLSVQISYIARAENFYLNNQRNKGALRFEINNDAVWDEDSNFTNGWSLQYHTKRYANWKETKQPKLMQWVGEHFPSLDHANAIVRNGHGIGQNMITPGDLTIATPQEGDLPYAGTLTYTLNWQSFNRTSARNLQVSLGVLGPESMAKEFQEFVHNDIGLGHDPLGWDTQRETEPILNLGYEYAFRLARLGNYHNDWAGQLALAPSASIGNLFTAVEVGLACRFGWNILEGFNSYPAPPGRGFFQASHLPKPGSASPHGFEMVLGARACQLFYSVIYDGSLITNDDRSVDRNNTIFAAGMGLFYHYYDVASIRVTFQKTSDILVAESIPDPVPGKKKTSSDVSFGSLVLDLHF